MATTEVIRDQKPLDLAPPDPNVSVPKHVRDAAALAESFYQAPEPAPEPAVESPAAEAVAPPAPEPAPEPVAPPPAAPEPAQDDWERRYHSMQGRYNASQRTIAAMQEQLQQLGDELLRTQAMVRAPAPSQPAPVHNKLITDDDVQNYGTELIDLTKRAAQEAVAPHLDALKAENETLKQQLTQNATKAALDELSIAVPNWKQINRSAEFKSWLRLPDVYSGQVRNTLLSDAYRAADAPRLISFFKGFLAEGAATGQIVQPAVPTPPPAAPREPAIQLNTIAAPGRARPAPGLNAPAAPADKPTFTRAQISDFYAHVRAGHYAGRETEKAATEQQIFAAQAEGRIR